MQNFEADLFMMVSRPSEANLGGRRAKCCRGFFVFAPTIVFYRVGSGFPRVEGVKPEARRGPNRGQLDPKIGQNLRTTKKYKNTYI